jgi:hypothetical protein
MSTAPTDYTSTTHLLSATLPKGINAYGRDGTKLGMVDALMIDMASGTARYAILSFGGFLGLGQKYHPVPFALLQLSSDRAGYIVNVDTLLLDGSPSYRPDDAPVFNAEYGRRIESYYRTGA